MPVMNSAAIRTRHTLCVTQYRIQALGRPHLPSSPRTDNDLNDLQPETTRYGYDSPYLPPLLLTDQKKLREMSLCCRCLSPAEMGAPGRNTAGQIPHQQTGAGDRADDRAACGGRWREKPRSVAGATLLTTCCRAQQRPTRAVSQGLAGNGKRKAREDRAGVGESQSPETTRRGPPPPHRCSAVGSLRHRCGWPEWSAG